MTHQQIQKEGEKIWRKIQYWNDDVEKELPNWRIGWKVLIFMIGLIVSAPFYILFKSIKFIFKKS